MQRIEFPKVDFDSPLVTSAFELERMRGSLGLGTTPPYLFLELHSIFQLLMSLVSARIEGNRTTVEDAVIGEISTWSEGQVDALKEIRNIRGAMEYIDAIDSAEPISHKLIRELHALAVDGLVREGDSTPGQYRNVDVGIQGSSHRPPQHMLLVPDMDHLVEFINRPVSVHQQLLHVAITHHRFLWVHPFKNGNGRVSRLLSYALLKKHNFVSPVGLKAVNPTAVFGNDRADYYRHLTLADGLTDEGVVAWCTFFVRGILGDIARLHQLQDFDFVKKSLIFPTLGRGVNAGILSATDQSALVRIVSSGPVKAGDLDDIFVGTQSHRSIAIRSLLERGLIRSAAKGPRFYQLSLGRNQLVPLLIRQLDVLGFLPAILKDD